MRPTSSHPGVLYPRAVFHAGLALQRGVAMVCRVGVTFEYVAYERLQPVISIDHPAPRRTGGLGMRRPDRLFSWPGLIAQAAETLDYSWHHTRRAKALPWQSRRVTPPASLEPLITPRRYVVGVAASCLFVRTLRVPHQFPASILRSLPAYHASIPSPTRRQAAVPERSPGQIAPDPGHCPRP